MADKNMEAQISVEFEEATSRQSLNSGETINTLWGKAKRWLTDLKSVAFSGSYNDLSDKPTTATADTDGLMSAEDKSKLDNADNTYALKSKYGDTTINVGRKDGTDIGEYSTAEGYNTTASVDYSHAEGYNTTASGYGSHAEGHSLNRVVDVITDFSSSTSKNVIITAWNDKKFTLSKGEASHTEGQNTVANGEVAHAEGYNTIANGNISHTEGQNTVANGEVAHAEGRGTIAGGLASHAAGAYTEALHSYEVAYGIYNKSNDDTLMSIGDGSPSARHNAFEITTTGGKLHDEEIMTQNKVSNPNLLINPDFKINQRGLATYSGNNVYGVDKWRCANNAYMTVVDNGLKVGLVKGATSTSISNIIQHIDDYAGLGGKTCTLSVNVSELAAVGGQVLIRVNDSSGVAKYPANIRIKSEGVSSVTFTMPEGITLIQVWLYGADMRVSGETVDNYTVFEWVKLEIGSTATPYSPPDPATELIKCQRYYQIRSTNNIAAVDLRPNMREGVNPTITALSDGNYSYSAEL